MDCISLVHNLYVTSLAPRPNFPSFPQIETPPARNISSSTWDHANFLPLACAPPRLLIYLISRPKDAVQCVWPRLGKSGEFQLRLLASRAFITPFDLDTHSGSPFFIPIIDFLHSPDSLCGVRTPFSIPHYLSLCLYRRGYHHITSQNLHDDHHHYDPQLRKRAIAEAKSKKNGNGDLNAPAEDGIVLVPVRPSGSSSGSGNINNDGRTNNNMMGMGMPMPMPMPAHDQHPSYHHHPSADQSSRGAYGNNERSTSYSPTMPISSAPPSNSRR